MSEDECKTGHYYDRLKQTLDELGKRVHQIQPPTGSIPEIDGIDICGNILPKEGSMGGDHIIYIDFNKRYNLEARIEAIENKWEEDIKEFSPKEMQNNRFLRKKEEEKNNIIKALKSNRNKAGVLVADIKGHDESASFIVGMLHQSFLTGVLYELKINGELTTNLFEKLNTRFYNSSTLDDFFTMIYGEITDEGTFRFLSAGHPAPLIFSNEFNHFVEIPQKMITNFPPIGILPSEKDVDANLIKSVLGYKQEYKVNEIELMGNGDIMFLFTDGLTELENNQNKLFFTTTLQELLIEKKFLTAKEICTAVKDSIYDFNPNPPDDITYVVIKKTLCQLY
jgi:serine phosphatase RsbU (regulator of sigma subunit)